MTDGTNIPVTVTTNPVLIVGPTGDDDEPDDEELGDEEFGGELLLLDVANVELSTATDDTDDVVLGVEPPVNPMNSLDVEGDGPIAAVGDAEPEDTEARIANGPSDVLPLSKAVPLEFPDVVLIPSRIPEIEPDDPVKVVSIAELTPLTPAPMEVLTPLLTVTPTVPVGSLPTVVVPELPTWGLTMIVKLESPLIDEVAEFDVAASHSCSPLIPNVGPPMLNGAASRLLSLSSNLASNSSAA